MDTIVQNSIKGDGGSSIHESYNFGSYNFGVSISIFYALISRLFFLSLIEQDLPTVFEDSLTMVNLLPNFPFLSL